MDRPILIADDDASVLSALRLLLKAAGQRCDTARSPAEALVALKKTDCALLLMDLNYQRDTTSGAEGMALIREVRALDAELPIVVMTGWGSIDIAVAAMRCGANDFIEKPWDNTRLSTIVRNLVQWGSQRRVRNTNRDGRWDGRRREARATDQPPLGRSFPSLVTRHASRFIGDAASKGGSCPRTSAAGTRRRR